MQTLTFTNHRQVNILDQEELENKIRSYKPKKYNTTQSNKWYVDLANDLINKFRFDNWYL